MNRRRRNQALCTIATLTLLSANIMAAPYTYRYKDSQSVTHIGDSVPPELVDNGYEVLNERGRVVDVVLPRSALDANTTQALKEAEHRHKQELQRSKDETLLRYYSSPADVERIRARKLEEFDNFISMQGGNIISFRKKIASLQSQAADLERGKRKIPTEILETIATLESKLREAEETIERKKTEKQKTYMAFEEDIQRLKYLVRGSPKPE